ncbi:MAG: metallophosphoesterase [Bacteroidales bacterium]|nr:metallophosphoesterase [Bacteroidales bacterium]
MKSPFSVLFGAALAVLATVVLTGARPPKTADLPVSANIYSISSGPGADASVSMRISWACDTFVGKTFVRLTEASDKKWKEARDIPASLHERFDAFNGVFSTAADGSDLYEDAIFTKCGASLKDLKPDTDYKYLIVEKDGDKAVARSSEHRFRTAGSDSWSACIISDFHSYPPIPTRLEAAMGMIDTMQEYDPSLDWILSPGDVVAWGGSYSFWRRLFEEDNFNEFFWARVNGNHDNWTRESQITHNFDIPSDYFIGTSFYPYNGYAGEEGVCYHFRYGNTLFVMLNTEDMAAGKEFAEAEEWVRNCIHLERASENPPTFVVVCMHYEWFIGTNGRTSEYARWHKVFDELGVDLAIAGNNHVYVRTHPLYDDKVTDGTSGTVYLQTSASDNDRGRALSDAPLQNADKIAVRWTEGTYSVSAIHMDVNPERIALTLMDRHGQAIDSTVIPAKPCSDTQVFHVEYGPWVTDMSETAFTVLWSTDIPCQGWVQLENGRRVYEEYAGRKLFGKLHTVRVEGLSRGAQYKYRLGNRVVDPTDPYRPSFGREVLSEPYAVTTFDPNRKTCHFTVFNDVHMRLDHYAAMVEDIDVAGNDFLLLNGDIISAGNWTVDSLLKYEVGQLGVCRGNLPLFFSRGNHEGRGSGVALVEKVFPKVGTAPFYYTFREGPAAFIVLDAGETGPGNSLALTGSRLYEDYLREQMAWAEKAMQEPAFRDAPVKICVIHAPMVDPEASDPDDYVPHKWMNHNFLPLLNKAGIDLMIGADLHRYEYHPVGEMNNDFPILVNDDESRLDVRVQRDRISLTIYDEDGKVVVPTREIPVSADGNTASEPSYPLFWTWLDLRPDIDFEAICQKMNDAGIDGVMLNAPTPDDYRRVIPIAKAHGITVYAWIWTMNPEHDRDNVLATHPEWFSVNRLGRSLADTTAYVDYYKFLCPALPEVRDYINEKVRAYCEVDGLDGIAIDYHRFVDVVLPTTLWPRYGIVQDREYPEWDFGYHPEMIRLFQEQYGYDPREEADPSQDVLWRQFRCDQITEVANMIANTVHSYGKVMAASPFPTPKMASRMVRQDWGKWDLDVVFPMVYHNFYTLDPSFAYDCTAENYHDKGSGTTLYCGLMYSDDITDCMDEAFRAGAQGIAIFTILTMRTPEQLSRFKAYTDSVRTVVAANGGRLPKVTAPGRADTDPFHHPGVMAQIEKRIQYIIAGFDWNRRPRRGEPRIQVPELAPLSLGEYKYLGSKDITRLYEVTDAASGTTFLVTFYLYGDVISGWDVVRK